MNTLSLTKVTKIYNGMTTSGRCCLCVSGSWAVVVRHFSALRLLVHVHLRVRTGSPDAGMVKLAIVVEV